MIAVGSSELDIKGDDGSLSKGGKMSDEQTIMIEFDSTVHINGRGCIIGILVLLSMICE